MVAFATRLRKAGLVFKAFFCMRYFINSNIFDRKTMSEKYKVIDNTIPTFITITVGSATDEIYVVTLRKLR
jgi:hypothetical protein